MTIVVTGATGNVGRHVARLMRERGETVRTVPEFEGGERVFLACGNVPEQVEFECSVIDAAAAAGVSRVVKLSGPAASDDSPMIFERWHARIERHLAASGLPAVVLRPKTYLTNLLAFAPAIAATGTLFAPAAGARVAFVDPRDIAEVAAVALIEPGHDGATYELSGPEAITYDRVAAALSAAAGSPIAFRDVGDDTARSMLVADGVPEMVADAIVAIFAAQRAGALSGVTGTIQELTGRAPRTVEEWAHDNRDAFRPVSAAAARTPA